MIVDVVVPGVFLSGVLYENIREEFVVEGTRAVDYYAAVILFLTSTTPGAVVFSFAIY